MRVFKEAINVTTAFQYVTESLHLWNGPPVFCNTTSGEQAGRDNQRRQLSSYNLSKGPKDTSSLGFQRGKADVIWQPTSYEADLLTDPSAKSGNILVTCRYNNQC